MFGNYTTFFNKKPSFYESFGLWMNKDRIEHKKMNVICIGVGIAMGFIDPGLAYFQSITDGKSEAQLMKAQYDLIRKMNREQ